MLEKYLKSHKIIFFDVGGKGGALELPKLAPYIKVYVFEPNPMEFSKLLTLKIKLNYAEVHNFELALSDHEGIEPFYITRNSSYSSLLKFDKASFNRHLGLMKQYQNWEDGFDVKETLNVRTTAIDSFCKENNVSDIDFLKLDTQGSELKILKGCRQLLQKIGVLKCEVNFVAAYKEQSLFSDIDLFLRQNGFEFVDCIFYPNIVYDIPTGWEKQKIVDRPRYSGGGDAIYINTRLEGERKFFKAGIILCELGYLSEAYSFLKECLNESEIERIFRILSDRPLADKIKNFIKGWMPPRFYSLLKRILTKR